MELSLTHWHQSEMANILDGISNAFWEMKTCEITNISLEYISVVWLTENLGLIKDLVPNMWQAITLTNVYQEAWGHYILATPYGVWFIAHHWLKYWIDVIWVPGHYLNQFCLSVNGAPINLWAPKRNDIHVADSI